MGASILLIDDEEATRFGVSKFLARSGYRIDTADSISEARDRMGQRRYDVILLDLNLPDGNGLNEMPRIRRILPDAAIVVITGQGEVETAVNAMREGADNFLSKPIDLKELDVFIRKSVELETLRRSSTVSRRMSRPLEPFIPHNEAGELIRDFISLVSDNDAVVLLTGETGTGKGVMARWIHEGSVRADKPFVEINCASLKGELLASELFGHTKGAFTSAHEAKEGLVEVADGGTLFLDEIGEMDPAVQAQFLKTIEEKSFRRVGETQIRHSDFRLICATNRTLEEEVKAGGFRRDLFYRINMFPIALPAVRFMRDQVPDLVKYIVNQIAPQTPSLPKEVFDILCMYDWPGNIRELKNMLERAFMLARGKNIAAAHFPGIGATGKMQMGSISSSATSPDMDTDLDTAIKKHILAVMQACHNDTVQASKKLGISRASLYRKLEKYKK